MPGKHLPGKQFALYTHSLTKVPESEEAGIGLVDMGTKTKGDGFAFLQSKGWFNGIV